MIDIYLIRLTQDQSMTGLVDSIDKQLSPSFVHDLFNLVSFFICYLSETFYREHGVATLSLEEITVETSKFQVTSQILLKHKLSHAIR
jgi:hypothetical protein